MIHVSMAENHGIDIFGWIKREECILFHRLLPVPLEEAAIEENAFSVHLQFVAAAGNLTRRTMMNDFHVCDSNPTSSRSRHTSSGESIRPSPAFNFLSSNVIISIRRRPTTSLHTF